MGPTPNRKTAPKLTLNGIVETALFVKELARACDFYEQVLGLTNVKASETGCVFRTRNQEYLPIVSRKAALAVPSQNEIVSPARSPGFASPFTRLT